MNNKGDNSEAALLRKKALEILKKRPSKSTVKLSEVDTLMLVHELEVHQVELEMQNEELIRAKSILHEAVEKYTELYDFAPSGYFTLSSEGKIIELNFRGSKMLGKERAKLINSRLGFFVSNDTKTIFVQFLEAVFTNKTSESCEVILVVNDKPPFNVYISGIIAENETHCHVTIVDITECTKVDKEIKLSEERYMGLLNNLEAGVVVHAPDTSIIHSNPKASQLLGLSIEQMKGKLAIDPNWRFMDENNVNMPIEKYPVNLILSTKKIIKNLKVAVNRPVTNDLVWLIVNGFPVFNSNDEIAEVIISFVDITEQKTTEQKKAKEHEENEALINTTTDLLWSVSCDFKLIAGNKAFLNGLKENGGYLIKPGDDLLNPEYYSDDYMQYWRGYYSTALAGETVLIEIASPQVNSTDSIWLEIKIEPIWLGNTITGIACHGREITERKKAAKKLEESERYLKETQLIANLGTYTLDIATGNWTCTALLDQILGIDADFEKTFEGGQMIIHPDWRKIMTDYFSELVAGKKSRFDIEYKIIRPNDNEERWIHGIGNLKFDDTFQPVTLLATIQDITHLKQEEEKLINTSEQLRQLTAHLQTIREDERKRIGREIHDELGQQLTAIKMDVAWIDKKTPGLNALTDDTILIKNKLQNIITLLDGSNQTVRKILNELRPRLLDDRSLLEAMEWQGIQFTESTGIPVKLLIPETNFSLPEEISTCIFRVYQESLTNITRYANANNVLTSLSIRDNSIILTIKDDGKGFDTTAVQNKITFGIMGMKERVLSFNGNFDLVSSHGKGTKIMISLPYEN